MNTIDVVTIIGGLCGFVSFVMFLESETMGNIIFRNGVFVPFNILTYIINPFFKRELWYVPLWRANWLIMTSFGALLFRAGYSSIDYVSNEIN